VRGGDNRERIDFATVRNAVTFEMVLARYGIMGDMKRVGSQYVGCCPLHHGSNPKQFVVNPKTSTWFCFGDCDVGGGVLDFVALREQVSIREAAQLLAEWFTISPAPPAHHCKQRSTHMAARPSHILWILEDRYNDAEDDPKPIRHRVGAAWPGKDGKSWLLRITPGISVSGRLQLREYEEYQRDTSKASTE
jgi:hypothetical protein